MSVAVAYLRSDAGGKALAAAVQEAVERDTTLHVIHVVEVLDSAVVDTHRDEVTADVQRVLDDQDAPDLSWELELGTEDEGVADLIVARAESVGAELLVVGRRRRSTAATLVFGSVSREVEQRASIAVRAVEGED